MRRRLFAVVLILTAGLLAIVLAFPAPTSVCLGLLRHEAFFAGKPTNYWIRALKRDSFLGQAESSGDIGKTLRDGGSAAVGVLCEMAQNTDDTLRSEALRDLALMGPEARAATPVLAATIKKEKNSGRFLLASETLAKIEPAAAAEALSAVLRNQQDDTRRAWALTELLKLAPKGQEALPVLKQMAQDPHEDVRLRVQAIRVLWRMNEPVEPWIPAMCTLLNADAGVQALEVLGEMGPAAKPFLPALLKLLEKPTLPLVGRRWGPPHRAAVIRTLGRIGPEARAALPALIASLDRDNFYLRTEVALALAQLGSPAKEVLAAREAVWGTSVAVLAARPPASIAAFPLINRMRRTWIPPDAQSREAVHAAVLRIDPDAATRAGAP